MVARTLPKPHSQVLARQTKTGKRSSKMEEENIGFIYIAENKAMPNLYKIGRSGKEDLNERINGLFKTGVPLPFNCVYAGEVANFKDVEEDIHDALDDHRVHPKREFFAIKPNLIIPWIERTFPTIKNVTESVNKKIDEMIEDIDKKADELYAEKVRFPSKHNKKTFKKKLHDKKTDKKEIKKRPQFKFNEMGIRNGEMITFINDERIKVKVAPDNYVVYRREEYRLSELTAELLDSAADRVAPLKYWEYKGKSLQERYNKTYGEKA